MPKTEFRVHCIGCGRSPEEIAEYQYSARYHGMTPAEYVAEEEGTYNMENGHFTCTACYLKMGQPVRDDGKRWIAP